MISKNRLRELAAYRMQKRCDEEAVFVVEGPKMCAEALASGFGIRVVCASAEWLSVHAADAEALAAEVYEVGAAELERLSNMKSPNQVWMLLSREGGIPGAGSAGRSEGENPGASGTGNTASGARDMAILALDRIQDPGNMGTMLRTADWFGVRRVVCSADTASCYNPKVVQASMGAIFRTRVEYVDLPQWLAACGMPVYGASLRGEPLQACPRPTAGGVVLVVGNESRGISPQTMALVTHPVLIPNLGNTAESLNASVAAGILMHWLTN